MLAKLPCIQPLLVLGTCRDHLWEAKPSLQGPRALCSPVAGAPWEAWP